MRLWRLSRFREPGKAFGGDGARLFPGRWNELGTPAAYASEHLSLAVLELLVHMTPTQMRVLHHAFPVDVPDDLVESLPAANLPADWGAADSPPSTQALGSAWAKSGRSLALLVPSAVLPFERNAVLNPAHVRFDEVKIGAPQPYSFDPRLLKATPRWLR